MVAGDKTFTYWKTHAFPQLGLNGYFQGKGLEQEKGENTVESSRKEGNKINRLKRKGEINEGGIRDK